MNKLSNDVPSIEVWTCFHEVLVHQNKNLMFFDPVWLLWRPFWYGKGPLTYVFYNCFAILMKIPLKWCHTLYAYLLSLVELRAPEVAICAQAMKLPSPRLAVPVKFFIFSFVSMASKLNILNLDSSANITFFQKPMSSQTRL